MKYPILEASMCLVKRAKLKKPAPPSELSPSPRTRSKPKIPDESSLEITNSTTNSSKESRLSSGSATSLTNIREMLSDGPIIFQFKDLCKATDNFSASKKVGTSVYRGKLQKTEMAIVVDKKGSGSNCTNFVAEIKNLGSVHHSNLVRLLGGCMNGDNVYLVYNYIGGGNLRQCLHSSRSPGFSALPTWMSRIKVALEVSKGLEYLHHHTLVQAVHKYMKSSNILLDEDLHAQIAYFGVAKIRGEVGAEAAKIKTVSEELKALHEEQGEIQREREHAVEDRKRALRSLRRSPSIKITGTHGYMAPEYVSGGVISPKLDVFAFGVILLELLSGKEPVSFQANDTHTQMKKALLTDIIVSIFAERDPKHRLRAWIDPLLRDQFPLDCALKAAQLARNCVDPDPACRPDMSKVSMTLGRIQMSSQIWEQTMKASKDFLTCTIQAR